MEHNLEAIVGNMEAIQKIIEYRKERKANASFWGIQMTKNRLPKPPYTMVAPCGASMVIGEGGREPAFNKSEVCELVNKFDWKIVSKRKGLEVTF